MAKASSRFYGNDKYIFQVFSSMHHLKLEKGICLIHLYRGLFFFSHLVGEPIYVALRVRVIQL